MCAKSHDEALCSDRAVIRPHADTLARRTSEGAILLQLKTNLIYELNETGTELWDLIVALGERGAILERLSRNYDIDEAALAREIDAALRSLADANLITVHERE